MTSVSTHRLALVRLLGSVAVGLLLLSDACSYNLFPSDPLSGRERGCYTALETALGVKAPSAFRTIELLGGFAFLGGSVVAFALRFRRRNSEGLHRVSPE